MVKSGIGFLVGTAAAIGVGLFVMKNASAAPSSGIVRTRKGVPPFSPPHSPDSLRQMTFPGSSDPTTLAMQNELSTWFADDRNVILAPDGSRVLFPAADHVTGVFDLATAVATWIFQTWNNTFMLNDPNGADLSDPDGIPDAMTLAAIQRYNRS